MVKPIVLVTRPLGWENFESTKLDVRYIPIAGDNPARKNGKMAPEGHYAAATRDGIELLIRSMATIRPQVLMRWVNTKMTRKDIIRIREASPKTVIMVADGNQPDRVSKHMKKYAEFVDVPLINSKDPKTISAYKQGGFKLVDTLYEAVTPKEHTRLELFAPYHCFFAGSNRRKRMKDGNTWKWDFPGGKFRFEMVMAIARNWKVLIRGEQKQWPIKTHPNLIGLKYYREFQKARIILGANQFELKEYYPRRLFHAGASGRMVLYKKVPGMENNFTNRRQLVWFENVAQAESLVAYYIKHADDREKMAVSARAYFLKNHSWRARLGDFEKIVKEVLA